MISNFDNGIVAIWRDGAIINSMVARVLCGAAVALLAVGCQTSVAGIDSDSIDLGTYDSDFPVMSVDTKVAATTVRVGESLAVECDVLPEELAGRATLIHADGPSVPIISGHNVLFCKEGAYTIWCSVALTQVVDSQPETVVVVSADTVSGILSLETHTAVAGQPISLGCQIPDVGCGDLQPKDPWVPDLSPETEFDFAEETLTIYRAGDYRLGCHWGTEPVGEIQGGDDLMVVPGPVAKVDTNTEMLSAVVGQMVPVDCSAVDTFDNSIDLISGHKIELETDAGLDIVHTSITTTKAGDYAISCIVDGIGDDSPIIITFEPGVALTIEAALVPSNPYYAKGSSIAVSVTQTDIAGNTSQLGPAEYLLTCELPAKVNAAKKIVPQEEGWQHCTVCLVESPDLCRDLAFLCDDGPPKVQLNHPQPGSVIHGTDSVMVEALVEDPGAGVAGVWINGVEAQLDEPGVYVATVEPQFGLNLISIVAKDLVGQATSEGVATSLNPVWSYHWSHTVAECEGQPPQYLGVPRAIHASFPKYAIDCGCPNATDMAEPIRGIVEAFDFDDYLPWQLGQEDLLDCNYVFALEYLEVGSRYVAIEPDYGGLKLTLVLSGVTGKIGASAPENGCVDTFATLAIASITLDIRGDLYIQDGAVFFDVTTNDVTLNGFTLVPEQGSVLVAVKAWLISWVSDLLEPFVESKLGGLVDSTVAEVAGQLMASATFGTTVSVPSLTAGLPVLDLPLSFVLDEAGAEPEGISPALDLRVGSGGACGAVQQKPPLTSACGVTPGSGYGFSFSEYQTASELALSVDAVNVALWVAWANGVLDYEYKSNDPASINSSLSGFTAIDLLIQPSLAPVLNNCVETTALLQVAELVVLIRLYVAGESEPAAEILMVLAIQAPLTVSIMGSTETSDLMQIKPGEPQILGWRVASVAGAMGPLVEVLLPGMLEETSPLFAQLESLVTGLHVEWELPSVAFALPISVVGSPDVWSVRYDAKSIDTGMAGWIHAVGEPKFTPQ